MLCYFTRSYLSQATPEVVIIYPGTYPFNLGDATGYQYDLNFGETGPVAPNVTIVSPTNTTYDNATILANISSDGDNVWFYNGTANETYTT